MKLSLSFTLRFGVALLCAVIAGANAFATGYVVNSTGDDAWFANKTAICETGFSNDVCAPAPPASKA